MTHRSRRARRRLSGPAGVLLAGLGLGVAHEIWSVLLWAAELGTSWNDPWIWEGWEFAIFVIVWTLLPFAALAKMWEGLTRTGRWLLFVALVVLTLAGQIAVETDDSSTAAIGFLFFPFYLLVGVLVGWVVDRAASDIGDRLRNVKREKLS
jgi:hypothetical protein